MDETRLRLQATIASIEKAVELIKQRQIGIVDQIKALQKYLKSTNVELSHQQSTLNVLRNVLDRNHPAPSPTATTVRSTSSDVPSPSPTVRDTPDRPRTPQHVPGNVLIRDTSQVSKDKSPVAGAAINAFVGSAHCGNAVSSPQTLQRTANKIPGNAFSVVAAAGNSRTDGNSINDHDAEEYETGDDSPRDDDNDDDGGVLCANAGLYADGDDDDEDEDAFVVEEDDDEEDVTDEEDTVMYTDDDEEQEEAQNDKHTDDYEELEIAVPRAGRQRMAEARGGGRANTPTPPLLLQQQHSPQQLPIMSVVSPAYVNSALQPQQPPQRTGNNNGGRDVTTADEDDDGDDEDEQDEDEVRIVTTAPAKKTRKSRRQRPGTRKRGGR